MPHRQTDRQKDGQCDIISQFDAAQLLGVVPDPVFPVWAEHSSDPHQGEAVRLRAVGAGGLQAEQKFVNSWQFVVFWGTLFQIDIPRTKMYVEKIIRKTCYLSPNQLST